MYLVLPIALAVLLPTWLLLRRSTRNWVNRPPSFLESLLNGFIAWLFFASLIAWGTGIVLTLVSFLAKHEAVDLWALLFASMLTGYGIDFIVRSRSEMRLDDTFDFIKEAIQFRRSAQRRLDLLSLMQSRKGRKKHDRIGNDPDSRHRARLQADLTKGKELEVQLTLLREGTPLDILDVWRIQTKEHPAHPLYAKIEEVRVEPRRKRLALYADFREFDETYLQDEMNVLRFNRQVYDFLQSLNVEAWLKPYAQFFESYYLMCRAIKINTEKEEVLYPFMKVGVLIAELRKLEGTYFNPRKLPEITALAFNNGGQV